MYYPNLRLAAMAGVCVLLVACGSGVPSNGKHARAAQAAAPNVDTIPTSERLFANVAGNTLTLSANGIVGSVSTPTAGSRAGQTLITVSGLRFSVSNATVSRGVAALSAASLRVGQSVVASGTLRRGSAVVDAFEVRVASGVVGIVEAVDAAAGTLQVQGQTVVVADTTEYEGMAGAAELAGIDQLVAGNFVDVVGNYDSNENSIQASEISYVAEAFVPGEMTIKVAGPLSGLDTSNADALVFNINAAAIDYTHAELLDFPVDDSGAPIISDGQIVAVSGTSLTEAGAVIAETVQFIADAPAATAATGTATVDAAATGLTVLQGRVSAVAGGGQLIFVNGLTVFVGSSPINNIRATGKTPRIAVNALVTVVGSVDSNGVFVAQDITVINGDVALKIEAPVESYDAEAGTLTFLGVVNVAVTDITLYDDTTLEAIIAALDAGETPTLEVEADFHEDGSLVAHSIEMEDGLTTMVKLRGPAANIDDVAMSFDIVGVVVGVADTTIYVLDRADVTAAEFFAALVEAGEGAAVKVRGAFDAETGAITASSLMLRTAAVVSPAPVSAATTAAAGASAPPANALPRRSKI
mgnify:CR=1 FL=1